jgi:beta-galactosidase
MRDWVETNLVLTTSDPVANRFTLWKRRFAPQTRVELGPNVTLSVGTPAAMYTVIVRSVRPSVTYAADPTDATAAEWTIRVGVGDRYGLNFRYASSATVAVPVELAVVNPDGSIFCTRVLEFAPTGGAEQILRTRTCESINAGTYRIRLSAARITDLRLGKLEVE